MEDLLYADVSAWSRFSLAGPSGGPEAGGQYFYVDTAAATFKYRSSTWPLRQFFKYVRPGAVRVQASSSDPAVTAVAFRRRQGGFVVVANTSGQIHLSITGLPAGSYGVTWADREGAKPDSMVRTSGSDKALTVTVPGKATVTITSSP
jgi:glucosylceramidase